MTPAFYAHDGAVYWSTVKLDPAGVDALLDLFEGHGDQPDARAAFNDLYAAHIAAGGIERGTSLRLVAGDLDVFLTLAGEG